MIAQQQLLQARREGRQVLLCRVLPPPSTRRLSAAKDAPALLFAPLVENHALFVKLFAVRETAVPGMADVDLRDDRSIPVRKLALVVHVHDRITVLAGQRRFLQVAF